MQNLTSGSQLVPNKLKELGHPNELDKMSKGKVVSVK